jgi:hypothetical protein
MFERINKQITLDQRSSDLLFSGPFMMVGVLIQMKVLRQAEPITLYELLLFMYCCGQELEVQHRIHAKEKQDYLYAFAGLVQEDWGKPGVEIDYKKPWQEAFIDTTFHMIREGHIELLSLCQINLEAISTEPPSWVPVWYEKIIFPNLRIICSQDGQLVGNSLFLASGSTSLNVQLVRIETIEKAVQWCLNFEGVLLDVVKSTKPAYRRHLEFPEGDAANRASFYRNFNKSILQLCKDARKSSQKIYSRSSIENAVWKMPLWDQEYIRSETEGPILGDGWYRMQQCSKISKYRHKSLVHLCKSVDAYLKIQETSTDETSRKHLTKFGSWSRLQTQKFMTSYHFFRAQKVGLNFKYLSTWLKSLPRWIKTVPEPLNELSKSLDQATNHLLFSFEGGSSIRPFMTEQGYIAVGPGTSEPGDIVCIFHGSNVPHVLRPRSNDQGGYILLGETYVHGVMDGEFVRTNPGSTIFEIF